MKWSIYIVCSVLISAVLVGSVTAGAQPYLLPKINEIMSSNQTTLADEDGDYPDWLELYNPYEQDIDLAGYRLSDDPGDPQKWVFPSVVLPSKGFMVLFASDKDRRSGPYLHTNFKIQSDGEFLILYDPTGAVCDSLCNVLFTGEIATDVSRGRYPDGGPDFLFFEEPTPGVSNSDGGFEGYAGSVAASVPGGIYDAPLSVMLSTVNPDAVIRYTLDGSIPDTMSLEYDEPLDVTGTTILRARAYSENRLPGEVMTRSYLFDADHELPVVSVVSDPANLFDAETGIYVPGNDAAPEYPFEGANFYEDWERPAHVALFEPDGGGFSVEAGVRISGGLGTRWYNQKSLSVFMRPDYGMPVLDYRLFPDEPLSQYWSFKLRNGGQNWGGTLFKDGLIHRLMDNTHVDLQAYRPAVVYLNGEYWGIHNIREKLNEEYLASHHGVDPERVDMLEYVSPDQTVAVIEGDADHFEALLAYLETHDLAVDEYYEYVLTQIDVDNYIDYIIIQTYIGNTDWPDNNMKFWRPRTPNGRWRWLLFDTDYGFPDGNETYDTSHLFRVLQWGGPQVRLFNRLRRNERFLARFVNRYFDLINTLFRPESVAGLINEKRDEIAGEIDRHIARWGTSPDAIPSRNHWNEAVDFLYTYAENRHHTQYIKTHVAYGMNRTFPAEISVDVSPAGSGSVRLNTIVLDAFPWSGYYATGIPVPLTAIPAPGWRFDGWEGIDDAGIDAIADIADGLSITARFEPDSMPERQVTITEINYHSSPLFSPGDWVEIYNPHPYPVDISGWRFTDESDTGPFMLPPHTVLPSSGVAVLSEYGLAFRELFTDVSMVIGNLPFSLSNGGELLTLTDHEGTVVDSVRYRDTAPWPDTPDGNGPTLVLSDASLDNGIAGNWIASQGFGEPGIVTDSGVVAVEEPDAAPSAFVLEQNMPNPFNPATMIAFHVPEAGPVKLEVFSITGQNVATLIDRVMPAGFHRVRFDGGSRASGVYFYRLSAPGYQASRRMVLVK